MSTFKKVVLFFIFIFFIAFIILGVTYFRLNTVVNNLSENSGFGSFKETTQKAATTDSAGITSEVTNIELQKQIEILTASSSSLLEKIEDLEKNYSKTTTVGTTTPLFFQKQIIHIGSANTKERDWKDSGVGVTLNSEDYPTNVNATFEAGLSIVGGQAWARLVNKTTGAVMAVTEISNATSDTTWKSSSHFKLHSGNNAYSLEIRSSSGETANISGAKIILTQ